MVYGLEMEAVIKKQVEEMEFAEMKILRFALGVTRKDKIRNEYIRVTVKVERLGMEDERGQAEVVWTCHEERPRVCRKKGDQNGVTEKEEKRETKEKIFRGSERRYEGKLVRKRRMLKIRRFGERRYAVATSD